MSVLIHHLILRDSNPDLAREEDEQAALWEPARVWITRRLTVPEEALAARSGWRNTAQPDEEAGMTLSSLAPTGDCIRVEPKFKLRYEEPLAYIAKHEDDPPYFWGPPTPTGLSGGPPFVPGFTLLAAAQPKPKARARTRRETRLLAEAQTLPSNGLSEVGLRLDNAIGSESGSGIIRRRPPPVEEDMRVTKKLKTS